MGTKAGMRLYARLIITAALALFPYARVTYVTLRADIDVVPAIVFVADLREERDEQDSALRRTARPYARRDRPAWWRLRVAWLEYQLAKARGCYAQALRFDLEENARRTWGIARRFERRLAECRRAFCCAPALWGYEASAPAYEPLPAAVALPR